MPPRIGHVAHILAVYLRRSGCRLFRHLSATKISSPVLTGPMPSRSPTEFAFAGRLRYGDASMRCKQYGRCSGTVGEISQTPRMLPSELTNRCHLISASSPVPSRPGGSPKTHWCNTPVYVPLSRRRQIKMPPTRLITAEALDCQGRSRYTPLPDDLRGRRRGWSCSGREYRRQFAKTHILR